MKTLALVTALALTATIAVGVAAGLVYTIAHATVRILDALGGS